MPPSDYVFKWTLGALMNDASVAEMATLYSEHYGVWGAGSSGRDGQPIRMSVLMIRKFIGYEDVYVASAFLGNDLIGYAVVVQEKLGQSGYVSWVTQFVVHKAHRKRDVGKRILFSAWGMSNHYAWGLLTANPFAVRALESATRRRCDPGLIREFFPKILSMCSSKVGYVNQQTSLMLSADEAKANTEFYVDHASVPQMIIAASSEDKPWRLGMLSAGWEWVAFTFRRQPQFSLQHHEVETMLLASDEIVRTAYSRMPMEESHPWEKYTAYECDFIAQAIGITDDVRLLDFGCGSGRHLKEFANYDVDCTGVDYVLNRNKQEMNFRFVGADCRSVNLKERFDVAICLYDVVGSYADESSNRAILLNLRRHLKQGSMMLLSVMNLEYTRKIAKHTFRLKENPDRLLDLPPSNIMEKSGDVFNPDYFLLDVDTGVVYRKEQFSGGGDLPAEMIVRDRRFLMREIKELCGSADFKVIWSRSVRAGKWTTDCGSDGKELLLLCRAV